MNNWTKKQVLVLVSFSAVVLSFGFQNCSPVGVQDLASSNEKLGGQSVVIGDEHREIVEEHQEDGETHIVVGGNQEEPPEERPEEGPETGTGETVADKEKKEEGKKEHPENPGKDKDHHQAEGEKEDRPEGGSCDKDREEPRKEIKCLPKNQIAKEKGKSCKPERKNPCVLICHIPPGNPANRHEIVVSMNASDAHTKHGDQIGPCKPLEDNEVPSPVCEDEDEEEPENGGDNS